MQYLEERCQRINEAIFSGTGLPRPLEYYKRLKMQGYSGPDAQKETENAFGFADQRKEEERLSKEWNMLLDEKSALEKADREEKERLEREAAARKQAEKEERERREREAVAFQKAEAERAKAEAEKRERERFEQATANPVSQRLNGVILALDKSVASFQDKLRQNDTAKQRSDAAFDSDKKAEKKRFDDEKNSIDDNLRRSIAAIDSDVEECRRKLNKATADIDREVKSYHDRGIFAIDDELRRKKKDFDDRICRLATECSIASISFNGKRATSKKKEDILNGNLRKLRDDLSTYILQKEQEKEEFITTKYTPYKAKAEQKKEKLRKKMEPYEAAKKRERDALPFKLRCEDKIRESKSQYDNRILVITSKHKKEQAEIKQQRKEILADFVEQFSGVKRPLSVICKEIQNIQPPLNQLTEAHQNKAKGIPEFLALGQLHISFALPEGFQAKEWSKDVPHLLSFPFKKPLFGQYRANSGAPDNCLIRDLLMRLLFTMPVGSIQITAINPQRGETLDPFKTLTDIKKLVPAGKWLTLSEDFTKPLREHYDYVEECKRLYFRDGINNWAEYNARNPEQPLPYKMLFIFGFPDQFLGSSITQLKGILEEGIRCGILPIITIDDSKIDPQQEPDAAEIRNWLRKEAEPIHATYLPKLDRLNITAERSEPYIESERVEEYIQWIHTAYRY